MIRGNHVKHMYASGGGEKDVYMPSAYREGTTHTRCHTKKLVQNM